jgi:hypothetical protein
MISFIISLKLAKFKYISVLHIFIHPVICHYVFYKKILINLYLLLLKEVNDCIIIHVVYI